MTLREIIGRIRAWARRESLDRQLADDMQAHLELLARDLEAEGLSPAAAHDAARRQLGNVTGLREESRDAWGFPAIESVLQDIRYAIRGLRRSPGFTATVVITLALGIGANAAMFGVIDRLMFRPYPYVREPSSVNRVYIQTTYNGRTSTSIEVPYRRFLDLGTAPGIATIAGQSEWRFAVGTGDATRVRRVDGVSATLFELFDAAPVQGRWFSRAEDAEPAGTHVAVLGHALWRDEYGSGDVVGKTVRIGLFDHTIVGVAPPGFAGLAATRAPEIFVPVTTIPAQMGGWATQSFRANYSWDWLQVLVRRAPGVSTDQLSATLTDAYKRSRASARALNPRVLPDSLVQPRAIAGPVRQGAGPNPGREARVLTWVAGVAVIVLLIACANVANLMLARVMRRRREISVRLALGVRRARLVGQLLIEGVVLAAVGCISGLFVAQWCGAGIQALMLPGSPPFSVVDDWRTIGAAAVCGLAATLLTTIAPALMSVRSDLASTLKSGSRAGSGERSRLRSMLLTAQAALSVLLLVGAGLFVRSLDNVRSIPLGYDPRPVLEVTPDFRGHEMDSVRAAVVREQLLAAALAIPGVENAARVNSRLFATNTADLHVDGIDSVPALGRFNFQVGSSGYLDVMKTRILRGRNLLDTDTIGSPLVALVSESMGRALWPGKEPLGQCLHIGRGPQLPGRLAPCTTVVGVVENTAYQDIDDNPRFMYYVPIGQRGRDEIATLYVRMRAEDPRPDMERVRLALTRAMPGDGFVFVRPLQEIVDDRARSWRLGATLFSVFGALALVVAIVGLYGVVSYNVAQRMHELGVRVALGASTSDVTRLVVRQGVAFALAGVVIGVGLALIAARWIQPLLFRQSATDPVTYSAVAAAMLIAAAAASAIPAFRAARADPNVALRAD